MRGVRDGSDLFRRYWERYERQISSAALIGGFIIDWLTLTRIDQFFDNIVIIVYLLILAGSIVIVHFADSPLRERVAPDNTVRARVFFWLKLISPIVMQFAIGGLFSAFSIFYSRSAALTVSWPVVFFMFVMLIANEFLQRRYRRLTMQVSVMFFTVFSYAIFLVPILIGQIATWVFLLSGVVSLIVIATFLYLLRFITPTRFQQSKRGAIAGIIVIFLVVNIFYYLNFIPPIPLSLKQGRVAHQVERVNGDYRVTVEPYAVGDYITGRDTVHVSQRSPVYVFSSVFAPSGLRTNIVHEWQYWDPDQERWVDRGTISFAVVGGRDQGYRGYTQKQAHEPGHWRVDIQTPSGLVIGRLTFTIAHVSETPDVKTYTW